MKNIKKLSAFIFTLFSLQLESSDNQKSQDLEFPQHTTEKYIYNKTVSQQDNESIYSKIFGHYTNGQSVTDVTSEDLLSHRVTRKRTEVNTKDGISLITIETWTSRNPSYVTWVNGALVIAAIAGIVLGNAALGSQNREVKHVVSKELYKTLGNEYFDSLRLPEQQLWQRYGR